MLCSLTTVIKMVALLCIKTFVVPSSGSVSVGICTRYNIPIDEMCTVLIDKARCVEDSSVAVGCSLVSAQSYFFTPIVSFLVD